MVNKSKSQFKTTRPIKAIEPNNIHFLEVLKRIQSGDLNKGIIAELPDNEGSLFIDHFKVCNIIQKHGNMPLENMIITANEPTSMVTGYIEGKSYISFIYEFGTSGFILSSRKFNGHYVVTFFEVSDENYIKSVKNRGQVIFDNKKTP